MKHVKWSVRYVPIESKNKLLEVQEINGGLIGDLLADAIDYWYDNLPEEETFDASEADNLQPQVGQNITHLRNDVASLSHEIKS
jgi:hypothetical protein